MKIVVLAGGLSPERNVSLSSGSMIAQALREKGHEVALVDLFFGLEDYSDSLEELYNAPVPEQFKKVDRKAPDLNQVRASRKDQSPSFRAIRQVGIFQGEARQTRQKAKHSQKIYRGRSYRF